VREDVESGQILVSGLGELHLEVYFLKIIMILMKFKYFIFLIVKILKDRLEIDYGLKTTLSKFRVTYRETIYNTTKKTMTYFISFIFLKND